MKKYFRCPACDEMHEKIKSLAIEYSDLVNLVPDSTGYCRKC